MIKASNNPFECSPAIIGNGQPNALLFLGPILRNGNNFSIPSLNASARIAGVVRSNQNAFNYTIAPETTLNRIDWIIYTPTGLQHLVGEAFSTIVTSPTVPDPENTVLVKEYKIDGANVGEGSSPIIGDPFITKNQFNEAGDVNGRFYIGQQSNFLIGNPAITEVKGLCNTNEFEEGLYLGKWHYWTNLTDHSVWFRHLDDSDDAVRYPFYLPGEVDFELKPQTSILFFHSSVNIPINFEYGYLRFLSAYSSSVDVAEILSELQGNIATLDAEGKIFVPATDYSQPKTVSGLFTFLNGMFGMRNVANTFTSFFRNTNTAARTYTLPNRDGTLADNTDLAGKMNAATGTTNFLTKWISEGSIGISRILDTGTFLGIGTANAPEKDIALGNQSNKEIGIENSGSSSKGRDLILSAGKVINYALNTDFNPLNQSLRAWQGMTTHPNGNVYAFANGGDIYMQTGGAGNFVGTGQTTRDWQGIASHPNGNVYACVFGGTIYMQTAGAGAFVALSVPNRAYIGMTSHPNGNMYVAVSGGDIYVQTGGTGNFVATGQTSRAWWGMACTLNGHVYATVAGGDIYVQTGGTGNFATTGQSSRNWREITASPNGNVYAIANSQIYMQTAGVGIFSSLNQTARDYFGMTATSNGNIYACVSVGDIFMQQNDALGAPDLDGGALKLKSGTAKGTGKSRFEIYTGQKTASGTDMQVETLREYIDENGYHVYTSMPVYSDNAAAVAGGLPVGCEYRTATGVKMIVY